MFNTGTSKYEICQSQSCDVSSMFYIRHAEDELFQESETANANYSKHQYLQVSIILEIRNVKFHKCQCELCSVSIIQGTNVDKYQFEFDQ